MALQPEAGLQIPGLAAIRHRDVGQWPFARKRVSLQQAAIDALNRRLKGIKLVAGIAR